MRALAMAAAALVSTAASAAEVQVRPYGATSDGTAVQEVVVTNRNGVTVRFISYGTIITAIEVPDRNGRRENVALGFNDIAQYEARNGDYGMGATVGRFAGRIANARFPLDGREVRLTANLGPDALHGGPGKNFSAVHWQVRPIADGATMLYVSPAGEQGFPGTMTVTVTYRLLDDNSLRIDYQATTDAPTVLNLTNHSYFNLAGANMGTALDHVLQMPSDQYLETTEPGIPTGRLLPVARTPFDFRTPKAIRSCIGADHPQLNGRRGYNHSYVVEGSGPEPRFAARLSDPRSGRVMDVLTTEPSIHIYTAQYFPGTDRGPRGNLYQPMDGIALETQHYPDSPNRPEFPSTTLRPGETYRSTTVYRFGVEGGSVRAGERG